MSSNLSGKEESRLAPIRQVSLPLQKVLYIISGFVLFMSGFYVGKTYTNSPILEQQPSVTPLLTQTRDIPSTTPHLTSTHPPISSSFSSWDEVEDDFFQVRFKVPPEY